MKILFTGGPGGGKSTLIGLFMRNNRSCFINIPEMATLLFENNFPRLVDPKSVMATQKAIFDLQKSYELIYEGENFNDKHLLCDRGVLDCSIYWSYLGGTRNFYHEMNVTKKIILDRYSHVIFCQSAAANGYPISSGNEQRNESIRVASKIDKLLHDECCDHPNFTFIACEENFKDKIINGLNILEEVLKVKK